MPKHEHFNKLTPSQAERLAMLAEEAAEVVMACTKILRHGYDSHNPDATHLGDNRVQLNQEIRDFEAVVALMRDANDLHGLQPNPLLTTVQKRLKYTHHQQE